MDNNSTHKWTIREPGQLEKRTIKEDPVLHTQILPKFKMYILQYQIKEYVKKLRNNWVIL